MAMIVQHNMSAMNTNRQLGISTTALADSTEKLSSGYRINRAADDAAGLAISEKMRSQIRGLEQASVNAADGISMIQTAEGALNESHSILQRMRELAVQAANGTETDEDRGNIQDEIEQLQEELDRIAEDTEYNTMKLLDGSLSSASGNVTGAGPKFGIYDEGLRAFVTSDVAGVSVDVKASASAGGESAIWGNDGKTLTLNLHKGTTYTESEIDTLIANAKQEDSTAEAAPAQVEVNLRFGSLTATQDIDGIETVAGVKASTPFSRIIHESYDASLIVGVTHWMLTAKRYGEDYNHLGVMWQVTDQPESCELVYADAVENSNGGLTNGIIAYKFNLESGKEYTEEDLEQLFLKAGWEIEVTFKGPNPDEPHTFSYMGTYKPTSGAWMLTRGAGLGDTDAFLWQEKYDKGAGGSAGVTLQVGANEGQTMSFSIDDMSADALGVNGSKVDVSTQKGASDAISCIDGAIGKISKQRSLLGAVQNRLEHTISNLDNTAENLQNAESGIRDADMAQEMVVLSKYNILQQAGQAMLAQTNQSTQGVLSLLQG